MVFTFNELWSDLTTRLRSAIGSGEMRFEIPNWSRDKGFTGNTSRVEDVNYDEVVFSGERTTQSRRVSRRDFKKIFEDYWGPYKQGTVSRDELLHASRNSTYIISLLHWLESRDARD